MQICVYNFVFFFKFFNQIAIPNVNFAIYFWLQIIWYEITFVSQYRRKLKDTYFTWSVNIKNSITCNEINGKCVTLQAWKREIEIMFDICNQWFACMRERKLALTANHWRSHRTTHMVGKQYRAQVRNFRQWSKSLVHRSTDDRSAFANYRLHEIPLIANVCHLSRLNADLVDTAIKT